MLVLKQRAFALEVGCLEPAMSLVFIDSGQKAIDCLIFWNLMALIVSRRWIDVGRISENGSNFALFEGID